MEDLTGMRFGQWTVVGRDYEKSINQGIKGGLANVRVEKLSPLWKSI